MGPLDPRRSADRPVTRRPGTLTRHSFSFGAHYDPAATGVGPLVALNEELIDPGGGYDDHRHAGLDVVSWVAAGTVVHRDALTGDRTVPAGSVAVLRSGRGVVHAERCPAGQERPALLVQSWLATARTGGAAYEVADVRDRLRGGGLVALASGPGGPGAPLALTVAGAALRVARLVPGEECAVPTVRAGWLHLVSGELSLAGETGRSRAGGAGPSGSGSGGPSPAGGAGGVGVHGLHLAAGDGLPLAGGGRLVAAAGPGGAEVLVWEVPEGV